MAQAGTTQAWDDVYEHEGFIGFNVKDEKAVAIQIRGDSMEPQFREGTIAIVYPTWEAKSGDLVIARLNDGTVMFKRLHVDGNNYTFISINPIYPPLTVEKSKVEKTGPRRRHVPKPALIPRPQHNTPARRRPRRDRC